MDSAAVVIAFAIHPFLPVPPCFSAGIFACCGVGHDRIYMRHLLPQLPESPAHCVVHFVVLDHMAPVQAPALGAIQLLQPFVAEHQHWIGVDDQLGPLS